MKRWYIGLVYGEPLAIVRAVSWYRARCMAANLLGCDPTGVDVWEVT